jgi:hypothetical protein
MNTAGMGGQFMGQANQMLGQYQPQIFQPESQLGTQAQGMQYQHNMAVARAGMQQQQQLLNSFGQFGSMMMQNPNMFNFGNAGAGVGAGNVTTFDQFMGGSKLNGLSSPTFSSNPLMQGVSY